MRPRRIPPEVQPLRRLHLRDQQADRHSGHAPAVQAYRRRRHLRRAADPVRMDGAADLQHVPGRHAHLLREHRPLLHAVARMPAPEVAGDAAVDENDSDPAGQPVAAGLGRYLLEAQYPCLHQLLLLRHRRPVLPLAWPYPHETRAGHRRLACNHGREGVQAGQPVCVHRFGRGAPEPPNAVRDRSVFDPPAPLRGAVLPRPVRRRRVA